MKDRTGPKKETENTIGKMPVGKLHRCEHMYIYVHVHTQTFLFSGIILITYLKKTVL